MKHGTARYQRGCRCAVCVAATRLYHREWRRRTGRTGPTRNLRENYGLTLADVHALIAAQDGRCSICVEVLAPYAGGKGCRTHIDHDHATKRVRGVLCHLCNQGLGKFRDDPDRLERAVAYLRR